MKPLPPLNFDTACQFEPPASVNYARIKALHTHLKATVPRAYKGRIGRVFYFQFDSPKERDLFLLQVEQMVRRHGNGVVRM